MKRGRIASGDKIVDWLFQRITQILRRKGTNIELVRTLTETDRGRRKTLYGILHYGSNPYENEVLINGTHGMNRRSEGRGITLLHEAVHILMRTVGEKRVLNLEPLLWERLSPEQRHTIISFVPRRFTYQRRSRARRKS